MALTRLVVNRPTLIFVFVALMLLGGIVAGRSLVVQALPNTAAPAIMVELAYAGGSTTFIRDNIVAPLENEIAGGPGLEHMDSTIQAGQATITCTFRLGSDPNGDLSWVQRSVAAAGSQLPSDLLAPYIRIANPSQGAVMALALTSRTLSPERLAQLANAQIMPAIENTDGVADAAVRGLPQAAYNVVVDPALLSAANLTLNDVIATIQSNNVRAPGGIVYGKKETQIDVRGDLPTPPMIAALPIRVTPNASAMNAQAPSSSAEAPANAMAGALQPSGLAQVQNATMPAPVAAAPVPPAAQTLSSAASAATSGERLAVPAPAIPSTNPVPTGPAPQLSSGLSAGAALATGHAVGVLSPWSTVSANRTIGDFARVEYGSTPVRVYNSLDGEPGVGMDIHKFDDASEITVARTVASQLADYQRQFPDVHFRVDHVSATFSSEQVDGVVRTLVEGIALVALVMLFFLRSWRNAVVVLIAIPTSLCVTLIAMRALGLTLDVISLLGMSLVVGTLVDDSTVVLENIERHHRAGESPIVAALRGRGEIGNAAIVITLVDVVVFLPIVFLSGPVGRQLSEFGIVVAVATVTSLFVSFTVTPALAGLWSMRSPWRPWPVIETFNRGFDAVRHWYVRRVLIGAFRRPRPWIAGTLLLLAGAFALIPLGVVGEDYIPAGDQGEVFAQFTFPPGTPLEETRRLLAPLDRELNRWHDFESVESSFGGYYAPFGGFVQAGNTGEIHLYLKPGASVDGVVARVRRLAASRAHEAAAVVYQATSQTGGAAQPIDLLVTTSDGSEPGPYADRVAAVLRATPGARDVVNSATNVSPQVEVVFDRDLARTMDVSIGAAERRPDRRRLADHDARRPGADRRDLPAPRPGLARGRAGDADPHERRRDRPRRRRRAPALSSDAEPPHARGPAERRSRLGEPRALGAALERAARLPRTPRAREPAGGRLRRDLGEQQLRHDGPDAAPPGRIATGLVRARLSADDRALQRFPLAADHRRRDPARGDRRARLARAHAAVAQPLLADRRDPARRPRDEERDPARRLREHAAAARTREARGDRRERAHALPADRHDDVRDGRRDAPRRARARTGRRGPPQPRDRRDRRPAQLARAHARDRPARLPLGRAESRQALRRGRVRSRLAAARAGVLDDRVVGERRVRLDVVAGDANVRALARRDEHAVDVDRVEVDRDAPAVGVRPHDAAQTARVELRADVLDVPRDLVAHLDDRSVALVCDAVDDVALRPVLRLDRVHLDVFEALREPRHVLEVHREVVGPDERGVAFDVELQVRKRAQAEVDVQRGGIGLEVRHLRSAASEELRGFVGRGGRGGLGGQRGQSRDRGESVKRSIHHDARRPAPARGMVAISLSVRRG
jgi:multidrug efflux pump subunit AcrB